MNFSMLRSLFGGKPASPALSSSSAPLTPEQKRAADLLHAFLEGNRENGVTYWCVPRDTVVGAAILALPKEEQAQVVEAILPQIAGLDRRLADLRSKSAAASPSHRKEKEEMWHPRQQLNALLEALLRRKLPLLPATICGMAAWLAEQRYLQTFSYPLGGFVATVENRARQGAG